MTFSKSNYIKAIQSLKTSLELNGTVENSEQ